MSIFKVAPPSTGESNSFLDKVLHVVNAPGAAVAAGAKAYGAGEDISDAMASQFKLSGPQTNWRDVLKQEGILEGSPLAQTALGFAGDVVLDPTNLIPVGAVTKGLKMLGKVPGAAKAGKALKETSIAQDLGTKFIPHFEAPTTMPLSGVGPTYREQKTLLQMRQGGAATAQKKEIFNLLKGVNEADRKAIPDIIEGTAQAANAAQAKAAQDVQAYLAKLAQREIAAGTLDPANVLQNYISYVLPKGAMGKEVWARGVTAKSRFSKPRNLQNWTQAVAAGADPDPLKALQVRASVGGKAAATGEWMADVATKFGHATKLAPDFRKVTVPGVVKTSPLGQMLENTYFPPDVAKDLMRVMHISNEGRGAIAEMAQKVTGMWKGLATAANPGFHLRNFISNGWLMSVSGMSPAQVTAALARGTTKKGITAARLQEAEKFGIFSGGHFGEFQEQAAQTIAGKLNLPKRYMTAARGVGDTVEHGARLGMFDHFRRQGLSPEEAAMKVRNYLFNYDELTDFEKGIRRYAVPFYTWTRKAAPLVAQSLVDNPKLWARTNDAIVALENAAKDTGSYEELMPEWAKDDIQLPAGAGGLRSMGNPFPMTELNRMPGSQDEGTARYLQRQASMLAPMLKIPAELTFNTQLFTGFPIARDPLFGVKGEYTQTQPAYSPIGKAAGAALGYGTEKGRQTAPAILDYAAQQLPFFGSTFASPVQTGMKKGPGAALEDFIGMTSTKTGAERQEQRTKLAAKKKKADKTKSRLDRLAARVGTER